MDSLTLDTVQKFRCADCNDKTMPYQRCTLHHWHFKPVWGATRPHLTLREAVASEHVCETGSIQVAVIVAMAVAVPVAVATVVAVAAPSATIRQHGVCFIEGTANVVFRCFNFFGFSYRTKQRCACLIIDTATVVSRCCSCFEVQGEQPPSLGEAPFSAKSD